MDKKKLKEENLEKVAGGAVFPLIANMSKEEALEIAKQLGEESYVGEWMTMEADQFMNWWKSYHPDEK